MEYLELVDFRVPGDLRGGLILFRSHLSVLWAFSYLFYAFPDACKFRHEMFINMFGQFFYVFCKCFEQFFMFSGLLGKLMVRLWETLWDLMATAAPNYSLALRSVL